MTHIASDLIPAEVEVLRALCQPGVRFVTTADLAIEVDLSYSAVSSALVTLRRRELATDRSGPGAVRWSATELGAHAWSQLEGDARRLGAGRGARR
ncbi:MAG TPA: hypothetical protein VFR97_05035 [Capillimicrobium sp.]|nr:hypothetical protein [Capillimicrobium sp.]